MSLLSTIAGWFAPKTYKVSGVAPSSIDNRDYPFVPSGNPIPPKQDLRPDASTIENQLQLGSCTCQATVGACELLLKRSGKFQDLSRLFLYYVTREGENRLNQEGAQTRDAIKAAQKIGIPPEFMWPYSPASENTKPPESVYAFTKLLNRYEAIPVRPWMGEYNAKGIKAALADGLPVVFAMPITSDLFGVSGPLAKQFYRGYGYPGTEVVGNHAMVAVGYDDDLGGLIIRNSWGEDWGDSGYWLLTYAQCDVIFEAWAIRGFDGCEVVRFSDNQVKQAIQIGVSQGWTLQQFIDAAVEQGVSFRQLCRCVGVTEEQGREAIKNCNYPKEW